MKYMVCLFRGNDVFTLSERVHLAAARRDLALCGKLLAHMPPSSAGAIKIIVEDDSSDG